MEDIFLIPVAYKGREIQLSAKLLLTGYTHKFQVDVYGKQVFFEPDEEGTYRALASAADLDDRGPVNIELLGAVAKAIDFMLK
jgi:hypothetical protein